jgi:HNH endonuclease
MEQALTRLVWQRARAACEYCWLPQSLSPIPFEIDHIIAQKHGGATNAANLALACFYCNSFKGRTSLGSIPKQGGSFVSTIRVKTGGNSTFGGRARCWWDGLRSVGPLPLSLRSIITTPWPFGGRSSRRACSRAVAEAL